MRGKNTIFINGRHYDTLTGLPVELDEKMPSSVKTSAIADNQAEIHRQPVKHQHAKKQRSKTLKREFVKKPTPLTTNVAKEKSVTSVTKSEKITKFAPHPTATKHVDEIKKPIEQPTVVTAIHQKSAEKSIAAKPKTAKELKDYLIEAQMAAATPNTQKPKKTRAKARFKASSLMAASLAVMVFGGYLSYINMPNLSVRVAAAQAGVHAEYPNYTPTGYTFDGPVAYGDGQVRLNFAANGGNLQYSIIQQKSQWDSQALLDNYVASKTKDYSINDAGGLTIYTYGTNAAWVNRGVLYTIDGDAPLRTDQVIRIAQSM